MKNERKKTDYFEDDFRLLVLFEYLKIFFV